MHNCHLLENSCTIICDEDLARRGLDLLVVALTILSMPLGPSDVRTASLTARAADRFERRTSSGLSAFLNARTLFERAGAVCTDISIGVRSSLTPVNLPRVA